MAPRQERFVKEYAIDHNGAAAAVRAGYAPKNARITATKLLKKPAIKAKVAETNAQVAARLGLDAEYVLKGFRDNFERAMRAVEVLDFKGNPTGDYRYDGAVANKALEMIGKSLGLFVEKSEVKHLGEQPPQVIEIHLTESR